MTIQNVEAADAEVTVNMELARSYQKALRNLSEKLCIKNDITVSTLTRFPDVLATRHDVDEEQLWADVSARGSGAGYFTVASFSPAPKMKTGVEETACASSRRWAVGLKHRHVEATTSQPHGRDASSGHCRRRPSAGAIFGDKTAVDETVRLRNRSPSTAPFLGWTKPVGRKLDFLTQELNRGQHFGSSDGPGYHPHGGGRKGGDREDQRTDPEPRIKTVRRSSDEAHQHRLQSGQRTGAVVAVVSPDSARSSVW